MMTVEDKNKANELIEKALAKRKELLTLIDSKGEQYFKSEAPPVLWFGNLNSEKPKVVVISANPNNPQRIIKEVSIEEFNGYFKKDKVADWFGKKESDIKNGRIEDFLKGLGASFYDRGGDYDQAIHIDLLPFATTDSFRDIASELMKINGLREYINEHIRELIELIKPKLVIVNGVTNKDYFLECIETKQIMEKEIDKPVKVTIWQYEDINGAKVIAISRNMGSYCFVNKESLYSIGEQERKRLKL